MNIPDLRPEMDEITLDHCSVLGEKLNEALSVLYPGEDFKEACDNIDPSQMRDDLMTMFTPDAFFKLFSTPFGKGVIIGAFIQGFVLPQHVDEEAN